MSDQNDLAGQPTATCAINPYAPTQKVAPQALTFDLPQVPSLVVVLSTIGAVTISGGIFGVGMSIAASASLAILAFVVGCILAFIGAIVVVPLILLARIFLTSGEWTAGSVYRFGAVCGGLTGLLCVAGPSGLEPSSLVWGMVPGFVGCVLTTVMLVPLAGRVEQRRKRSAERL